MDSSRNMLEERLEKIISDFDDGSKTILVLNYSPILKSLNRSRDTIIRKRDVVLGRMKVWANNTNFDQSITRITKKHKNHAKYGSLGSSLTSIFKQRSFTSFKFFSNVKFIGYVDCEERQIDPNTRTTFTENIKFNNFIPTPSLNLTDKEKMKYLDRIVEEKNNQSHYSCICNKGGLRWLNVFEVLGKLYILGSHCAVEFPLLIKKEYEKRGNMYNLEKLRMDMCMTYNAINFDEDKEELQTLQDAIDAKNEEIRAYYKERTREMANLKKNVINGKINSDSKDLTVSDLKYVKCIERQMKKEAKELEKHRRLMIKQQLEMERMERERQEELAYEKLLKEIELNAEKERLERERIERIKELELKKELERLRVRQPINTFVKKHVKIIKTEKQNRLKLLEHLRNHTTETKNKLDNQATWRSMTRIQKLEMINTYREKVLSKKLKEQRALEEKNMEDARQRQREIIWEQDRILEEQRIKRQTLERLQQQKKHFDYSFKGKKDSKWEQNHG